MWIGCTTVLGSSTSPLRCVGGRAGRRVFSYRSEIKQVYDRQVTPPREKARFIYGSRRIVQDDKPIINWFAYVLEAGGQCRVIFVGQKLNLFEVLATFLAKGKWDTRVSCVSLSRDGGIKPTN